ncbi:MAG: hypothetical protein AB1757_28445 [Acidobacteriota bacterium]
MNFKPNKTITQIVLLSLTLTLVPSVFGWGDEGHRFINRNAAQKLPSDMPQFFRDAAARLEFLGPEPDRWRDNRQLFSALREVNAPDHFIDIDKPENFLSLPNDRYKYSDWLHAQGKDPKDIGYLPYSILEWYEKIQVLFRLWRDPRNAGEREQIEQNIIYYAGVLGHYVGDGANPLHTTIHYNGWSGSDNPDYLTREPLHWRFEGEYVKAQIKAEDFASLVNAASKLKDPFTDTMKYLLDSFKEVKPLYEMDKTARWEIANTKPESKQFVVKRLAVGSQMLANLWYTAWIDSK